MVLPAVNEAVACVRERIVADADLCDAGVIFGTGFAPHRGGPISVIRERGKKELLAIMADLKAKHGLRFEPDFGVGWGLTRMGSDPGLALLPTDIRWPPTRFEAKGRAWGNLLVAGAMGVRQDFYAPLARHFAASGLNVLTFDYRGMGGSRPESLARLDVDVHDWAHKDLGAMLREARAMSDVLPLTVLGHSLGGQILPIAPESGHVRASINVTAGSGWYRHNVRMPLQVRFLWYVAVPLLTPLFGYFPGRALRIVGDLPKGVAYQWRRWCLSPEYLLSEGDAAKSAYREWSAPILSYSFDDDAMITRAAVDSLESFYARAPLTRRHVVPAEVGEKAHRPLRLFLERSKPTLWKESLDWLRQSLQAA
jgi:predicted alpha/beta hydrolase